MQMQKGQKQKIEQQGSVKVSCSYKSSLNIDFSCFGVNQDNKLVDENYMIFYNQPESPNKEIRLTNIEKPTVFEIKLNQLPLSASKLVITAALDSANTATMKSLESMTFKLEGVGEVCEFNLTGADFQTEKAIIIAEIYQKDGVWRVGAVGQGFAGGLDALVVSFGGEVAAPTPAPTPAAAPVDVAKVNFLKNRINLEKNLATTAPKLLSLSKSAAVSLEKKGLGEHRAKVALCLDISGSMSSMYSSGLVQAFVEKILALGCRLDDDGSIDIFLFGEEGYQPTPITVNDFAGYVNRTIKKHPLEPDTKYGVAIEMVRRHYTNYKYERSEPFKADLPVYVMFLTDGQPSDKAAATRALKNASFEPIFWQFMGVGSANLSYLEKLDDLSGRYVDNADFFQVESLTQYTDEQLYEKLVNEYPQWLKAAKNKNMLP